MAKSNRLSKGGAGGGPGSRQVHRQEVREGKPRHGKNVRAVSQIGSSMGNHSTEGRSADKILRKAVERMEGGRGTPSELGNSVALNIGKGGPGKGRQVYFTGSQQTHGPVVGNSRPKGRDILSEFGPDFKR